MEALCHKRGLCSDDHGSVLFVEVCVCVHMPICVLHSLAKPAAAFLNHHLYATTYLLLNLSDSTCLSPLHLLFFKMCSRGRALYLLKVFRVVFSLSVGDLYPLASRKLLPKNRVCLHAGHIHTIPTVWVSEWVSVCVLIVCVCVSHGRIDCWLCPHKLLTDVLPQLRGKCEGGKYQHKCKQLNTSRCNYINIKITE